MIAYDLKCDNNHCFEGWFEDESAYRQQKKKALIACPICNTTRVDRIPSTFAIKAAGDGAGAPKVDMEQLNDKIVDFVTNNFDDVGSDFAKEALKMHYGAIEPRNIRGVSSTEEEKTLKEEGVDFFKIPMPPRTSSKSQN